MKSLKMFCCMIPVLSALLLFISACGSSSGDSSSTTTTITGSVFASSVSGASVVVKDGSGATVAGPVSTGANGSFSVAVPNSALAGNLQFQATGGTYSDEMTGTTTTAGILAAYATAGSVTTTVSINPATTVIHSLISQYSKTAGEARSLFNSAFGFTPDLSISCKNTPSTGGSNDERLAAFRAGAFSRLTQELGLTPDKQADLLAALARDLADGTLDGKNGSSPISLGTYTIDIQNKYDQTLVSYLSDTTHNLTRLEAGELGDLSFSKVALTNSYKVEYIPGMMAAAEGKTQFKIKVTKLSDGSAATGLSLSLMPTMHMSGMSHGAPVDVTITENPGGAYSCTVYYLMGSGKNMGFWHLAVMIGMETANFYPCVGMAMGGSTAKQRLHGSDDAGMSPMMTKYYFLFNDGAVSAATPTFKLYISHGEDMLMSFKPVSVGEVLSNPTGTVTAMTVLASTDSSFSSPSTAVHDGDGHWSVTGLTGLVSNQTTTIYVKLNVNAQDKTTDGSAASGTNAYASFVVKPGM